MRKSIPSYCNPGYAFLTKYRRNPKTTKETERPSKYRGKIATPNIQVRIAKTLNTLPIVFIAQELILSDDGVTHNFRYVGSTANVSAAKLNTNPQTALPDANQTIKEATLNQKQNQSKREIFPSQYFIERIAIIVGETKFTIARAIVAFAPVARYVSNVIKPIIAHNHQVTGWGSVLFLIIEIIYGIAAAPEITPADIPKIE